MKYVDIQQHLSCLQQAEQSLEMLYESVPDENMASSMVSVSAEYLCHVQELLLAFAETYEKYDVREIDEEGVDVYTAPVVNN